MRLARVRLLLSLFFALALAQAQVPRIATIQVFGYRQTPLSQIHDTLHLKPGDPLPSSKADLEEKLQDLPQVAQASLEAVCCESGKAILYVGIREKDAPVLSLFNEPDGNSALPAEIIEAYGRFLRSLNTAGEKGETAEDLSQGHSLIQNETARRAQLAFIPLAEDHLLALQLALRDSASEEQRAIAAYVLGYHPDKKKVAPLLQEALHDIDETVRTNAARAIAALATYSLENPKAGFTIDPSPFLVMLHSAAWQERNNAAHCLTSMTAKRDPELLRKIREQDFEPLREMARWKPPAHALAAWLLLGRIKGLDDKAIQEFWQKDALAKVIP